MDRDIVIPETLHHERLDKALAVLLPDLSRTRIKNLILAGAVSDGDIALVKPSQKISTDDELSIELPPVEDATPQPENIPLNILFEDDDVIVIDKPAGLVVHPAPGNWGGTLVNALLHHCGATLSGINGVKRPGIVHRLDKDTSGVMVVAKNDAAHQALSGQFAEHGRDGRLERGYIAFAWGRLRFGEATIHAPIGRDPANRLRMKVIPSGRDAITHAKELTHYENGKAIVSKISATLETGRTHQIRVHLSTEGTPLLGDPLYGVGFKSKASLLNEKARLALESLGERQALHAAKLSFHHPASDEKLTFISELPAELQKLEIALKNEGTGTPFITP
ncbi:MAG: RluA family pseudouridine synthase [Pseudomonadota bacterium]